jgi:hypothetical protein
MTTYATSGSISRVMSKTGADMIDLGLLFRGRKPPT